MPHDIMSLRVTKSKLGNKGSNLIDITNYISIRYKETRLYSFALIGFWSF